jgi:hypothetical protein
MTPGVGGRRAPPAAATEIILPTIPRRAEWLTLSLA